MTLPITPKQFERFVRKRYAPFLAKLLRQLGEDETIWNAERVIAVIADRIVDIRFVSEIDDGISAQFRKRLTIRIFPILPSSRNWAPKLQ